MIWAGYELGPAFGWSSMDCIFLGAILSISSTTIIIKALEELGKTKEKFAQLIFGILIVEDILAIVMIALLSGFATTGSFTPADLGMTVLKLGSFLGTLLLVGLIIVPRLLDYVAKFKSNEMLLVTVLGLCFGVSLLAVKLELQRRARRVPDRRHHRRSAPDPSHRSVDGAGARHVQRGFLRLHRSADRSRAHLGARGADPHHHRGGRRGPGDHLFVRDFCRGKRHAHFAAGRHGSRADRRVFLHHRLARACP